LRTALTPYDGITLSHLMTHATYIQKNRHLRVYSQLVSEVVIEYGCGGCGCDFIVGLGND